MNKTNEPALRTVLLYGHLGKKFGRVHQFMVGSPREAVQALCANFRDFRRYMIEHSEPGYRVLVNTSPKDLLECTFPVSSQETIRIVPVIAGSGAALKIIIGAILIYFSGPIGAGITSAMGGGAAAASVGAFATAAASSIGWSLVIGGVTQLLYNSPDAGPGDSERPENLPSYAFNGPVNTAAQGNCVPVCYGRLIIGSHLLSAGLTTEQML